MDIPSDGEALPSVHYLDVIYSLALRKFRMNLPDDNRMDHLPMANEAVQLARLQGLKKFPSVTRFVHGLPPSLRGITVSKFKGASSSSLKHARNKSRDEPNTPRDENMLDLSSPLHEA